jgi:hypothetical protein
MISAISISAFANACSTVAVSSSGVVGSIRSANNVIGDRATMHVVMSNFIVWSFLLLSRIVYKETGLVTFVTSPVLVLVY